MWSTPGPGAEASGRGKTAGDNAPGPVSTLEPAALTAAALPPGEAASHIAECGVASPGRSNGLIKMWRNLLERRLMALFQSITIIFLSMTIL